MKKILFVLVLLSVSFAYAEEITPDYAVFVDFDRANVQSFMVGGIRDYFAQAGLSVGEGRKAGVMLIAIKVEQHSDYYLYNITTIPTVSIVTPYLLQEVGLVDADMDGIQTIQYEALDLFTRTVQNISANQHEWAPGS